MSKVFLGVGHGGSDPGAIKYIKEADVNLAMALACRDYLQANGVEVRMSRTKDENDPISEEIRECNAYGPDLAVDIHNNAGGGDGFECYYYSKGGTSKTLAANIEAEVKAIGQNSRGLRIRLNADGSDYYGFIRCINAPSVICEGVFVDNAADAAQADTPAEQQAFGIAYAKGILKTLGIADKGGNAAQAVNPKPSSASAQKKYYRVGASWSNGKCQNQTGAYEILDYAIKACGAGQNVYDWNGNIVHKGSAASAPQTSYYPRYTGGSGSIAEALKAVGGDSSYANRSIIAQKNGITGYKGTAEQNMKMLTLLKQGKLIK